jgi:hypothetical protein
MVGVARSNLPRPTPYRYGCVAPGRPRAESFPILPANPVLWTEAGDLDTMKGALVAPRSAVEQHGLLLSLDTDLFFADR